MTDSSKGLNSYPSIYNLGHAALADLLADPVVVEEKIDGSQFSFGVIDGELRCRSKGAKIEVAEPEGMFRIGVDTAKALAADLHPGWTYRGEYLQKPKHNTLAYQRVPERHVMIFDINPGLETYLSVEAKRTEVARLGLEMVPTIHVGLLDSFDQFREIAERESCLGGVAMEGVVIKNYARYGPDKKALMGKYVREAFREAHAMEWKATNPSRTDVVEAIIDSLRTEARWRKAVQRLRDRGELEGSPRDIGPLLREVPLDVEKECAEMVMQKLYEWAWPSIRRGVTAGLPQWYKDELAKSMFPMEGQ